MNTRRALNDQEVEHMREGAFAGLPASVQLVRLTDRPAPRQANRQRALSEAGLSGALIKRALR